LAEKKNIYIFNLQEKINKNMYQNETNHVTKKTMTKGVLTLTTR